MREEDALGERIVALAVAEGLEGCRIRSDESRLQVRHEASSTSIVGLHVLVGRDLQDGAFVIGDEVKGESHPSGLGHVGAVLLEQASLGASFGNPQGHLQTVLPNLQDEGDHVVGGGVVVEATKVQGAVLLPLQGACRVDGEGLDAFSIQKPGDVRRDDVM